MESSPYDRTASIKCLFLHNDYDQNDRCSLLEPGIHGLGMYYHFGGSGFQLTCKTLFDTYMRLKCFLWLEETELHSEYPVTSTENRNSWNVDLWYF